jgi:3-hydroxyisobutyrate dehydrogenase-like beta-hydroxyacid dehydrogenase
MKVGFIGIGDLGQHMSRHVLEAGYELVVNDIRKEAARELLSKGAKWADTPQTIAGSCAVVLTCLPTPKDVEDVVYGEHGLAAGWKKGDILIDMSTNSPAVIRKIAKDAQVKGVEVLDAPVSPGGTGAQSRRLTIIVGGKIEVLEKVRNILDAIGDMIIHVGDVGCGNTAKLINNMIAFGCSQITFEGIVLGVKAGIDERLLREVIKNSSGANYGVQNSLPDIFAGYFEPSSHQHNSVKDIGLALAMAKEYSVPTPIGDAVAQQLAKANGPFSPELLSAVRVY